MREIKFRGMPIEDVECCETGEIVFKKDEFVYGNLVVDVGQCWIVSGVVEASGDSITFESWVEVDPETVGQFIGRKDKKGKEIYEGDFVMSSNFGCGPLVVRYDGERAAFVATSIKSCKCKEGRVLGYALSRPGWGKVRRIGNITGSDAG